MKYGWKYYFEPTPQNVGKWMLGIEGILVGVGSSAFSRKKNWPFTFCWPQAYSIN